MVAGIPTCLFWRTFLAELPNVIVFVLICLLEGAGHDNNSSPDQEAMALLTQGLLTGAQLNPVRLRSVGQLSGQLLESFVLCPSTGAGGVSGEWPCEWPNTTHSLGITRQGCARDCSFEKCSLI